MDLQTVLVSLGIAITILAVLGTGIVLLDFVKELRAKADMEEWEAFRISFDMAEKTIAIVTEKVVAKLEQLVAKDLREKVKNGLESKEELLALADEAYKEVITTVAPDVFELLGEAVSDIEGYVRNEIEKQVGLLKSKTNEGK